MNGSFENGPVDPDTISSGLLRRIQASDHSAWHKLVELYGTLVYRWCRQAGFQPSDAADIVQDVFLTVFQQVDRFRREYPGDSFRGWLWTVTRSRLVDHYRKRLVAKGGSTAQRHVNQLATAEQAADEVHIPGERARLLTRMLTLIRKDFETHTWQAFLGTAVQGRTARDVADELGMTDIAVRQAKFRVLSRLRDELADLE